MHFINVVGGRGLVAADVVCRRELLNYLSFYEQLKLTERPPAASTTQLQLGRIPSIDTISPSTTASLPTSITQYYARILSIVCIATMLCEFSRQMACEL